MFRGTDCVYVSMCVCGAYVAISDQAARWAVEFQCHSKVKWCFLDLHRTETAEPCRTAEKQCLAVRLNSVVLHWLAPWLVAEGSKLGQEDRPWSTCQHMVNLLQLPPLALLASTRHRGLGWHQVTDLLSKASGMLPCTLPVSWTAKGCNAWPAQVHAAFQQNVNKESQAVWEGFWSALETERVS